MDNPNNARNIYSPLLFPTEEVPFKKTKKPQKVSKPTRFWALLIVIVIAFSLLAFSLLLFLRPSTTSSPSGGGYACGPHTELIDNQCVGEDATAISNAAIASVIADKEAAIADKEAAVTDKLAAIAETAAANAAKQAAEIARDAAEEALKQALNQWQPASDGAFKTALVICLAETPDGSCPIFAASNDATTGNPYGVMGDWDVSAVTNMDKLFYSYGQFNQDISKWDTGAVTSMSRTFYQALAFNQDLSKWKTGAVTNMYRTFYRARAFNQDLKTWDTSKVTTMEEMFKEATAFNQDISGWDTSSLITSVDMFAPDNRCTKFAGYASACPDGYTNKGILARCAGAACADSDFLATGSCCAPL